MVWSDDPASVLQGIRYLTRGERAGRVAVAADFPALGRQGCVSGGTVTAVNFFSSSAVPHEALARLGRLFEVVFTTEAR